MKENKYMKQARLKGWNGTQLAERLNISRRHLGRMCVKPTAMFVLAIKGLEVRA